MRGSFVSQGGVQRARAACIGSEGLVAFRDGCDSSNFEVTVSTVINLRMVARRKDVWASGENKIADKPCRYTWRIGE